MARNYLRYFPKPFLDDLLNGRCLPVVGAGLSLNAKVPLGKKMPLWAGLGEAFAKELPDFSASGTLDAISAYEHEYGRPRLVEELASLLLVEDASPGEAHAAFCSIPFDIVCTTNFDFLLERQYQLTPRYVCPLVDEDQLAINATSAGTLLLKLHGDLHHPGRLIVTESDYDAFLSRYPLLATYLAALLISKTAFFIGYSLDDPDFRQIWSLVSERLGRSRRVAYALIVGGRPGDVARYERRGVKVINLPGTREKYGEVLAEAFRELSSYTLEHVFSVSKVTEEEPRRELRLPRDAATRLCFFSLPLDLVSFYRSRVFPLVENMGFVPVTADDVIAPGDNVNAKIEALMDRAAVIIVDPSSPWTRAEYDLALARAKADNAKRFGRRPPGLIVISGDTPTVDLLNTYYIQRPDDLFDDSDAFVAALIGRLEMLAHDVGLAQVNEPLRLFNAREHRAAVISALTQLETFIRRRLEVEYSGPTRRILPLAQLLDAALQQHIVSQGDAEKIRSWMRLRNEAVHTDRPVSRGEAKEVVEAVNQMLTL